MPMNSTCNHHCGIRCNAEGTVTREGHCPCAECTCPQAVPAAGEPVLAVKLPMCEWWYARAGDSRPWALPSRVPDPVALGRSNRARRDWENEPGGAETWAP